jgi:CBS domain-containing protein
MAAVWAADPGADGKGDRRGARGTHALPEPSRGRTQTGTMALEIAEIMNHDLFGVAPGDRVGDVLDLLLAYGVTAAPVLDEERRPVGFVALRDLVGAPRNAHVLTRMAAPADVVSIHMNLRVAAVHMAERSRHHLACVDDEGRAVGFVGALDVLRGLIGAPVPHPDTFSHVDRSSGLTWSDNALLTFEHARRVPAEPGIFKLIDAAPNRPDRVVWTEATPDLHHRLGELLSNPAEAPSHLVDAALCGRLWFRWAASAPALSASTHVS